ncbi:MAG: mechanosensitive ion channel domain-containing protein, partial [Pseudomonadota bacterium]
MEAVDFSWISEGRDLVVSYTPGVVGGVVILIIGWMISRIVARSVRAALSRIEQVDETLCNFFVSLVRYVILIFTGLAVLSAFGVQTASLIAIFGAAGLAVGLALQGTLSNVAAGVMLLLFRPFKVGDYIDGGGGAAGTVKELTLFTTELGTPDNVQIMPHQQPVGRVGAARGGPHRRCGARHAARARGRARVRAAGPAR